MTARVEVLNCPGCGAAISIVSKNCEYCCRPIVIKTLSSLFSIPQTELLKYKRSFADLGDNSNKDISLSKGLIFFRMKIYDLAINIFDQHISDDPSEPEAYFYRSLAMLRGIRPYLLKREDINNTETYLNAAIDIEPAAIFLFFRSYIRYDYFKRKFFNVKPTYDELIKKSIEAGLRGNEVNSLFGLLQLDVPDHISNIIENIPE